MTSKRLLNVNFHKLLHVPYSPLPAGSALLPKPLHWVARTFFVGFRRRLQYPVLRADLMGLRDHFLYRYGGCPPSVRALARKGP
jgi:hypothetical protein